MRTTICHWEGELSTFSNNREKEKDITSKQVEAVCSSDLIN